MDRYAVKYFSARYNAWFRYGIPFGTMNGAIACAVRLKRDGEVVKIEVVR